MCRPHRCGQLQKKSVSLTLNYISTGPYKINGVPLRRANHAYVIATSQKVDVSGVSVDDIDDEFFKDSSIDVS